MNTRVRPRQTRRRKALRLNQMALHDHDHAHLRALAVVAVLVALAVAGLWRGEPVTTGQAADGDTTSSHAVVRTPSPEASRFEETDYLPLVTVAPQYPPAAQAAGISGRCTVEFTVTAAGTTRDVRPVACDPPGVFDSAAVAAARQFKYRPRERAGEPVEVAGVRNEFLFSLAR